MMIERDKVGLTFIFLQLSVKLNLKFFNNIPLTSRCPFCHPCVVKKYVPKCIRNKWDKKICTTKYKLLHLLARLPINQCDVISHDFYNRAQLLLGQSMESNREKSGKSICSRNYPSKWGRNEACSKNGIKPWSPSGNYFLFFFHFFKLQNLIIGSFNLKVKKVTSVQ